MAKKVADLADFQVKKPASSGSVRNQAKKPTPSSREGERKQKAFRVRIDAVRELGLLKVETGKTEQELIEEALNLLFRKYKKPEVA